MLAGRSLCNKQQQMTEEQRRIKMKGEWYRNKLPLAAASSFRLTSYHKEHEMKTNDKHM